MYLTFSFLLQGLHQVQLCGKMVSNFQSAKHMLTEHWRCAWHGALRWGRGAQMSPSL